MTERQVQKNRLKDSLVKNTNDEEQPIRKKHFSLRIAALSLILLIFVAGGIYLFISTRHMTEYTIAWTKSAAGEGTQGGTFKGYELFNGGVINYSKDGAAHVDKNGEAVWERSYQMNQPRAFVNGSYAAIADIGGTDIYLFDDETNTGSVKTTLPIITATISRQGVIYTLLSDGSSEYLNAYRIDGSAIDLTVRSLITGDGYPLDIATSPDGSQLITAYMSIVGSDIRSQVIFRNFDEIGQNADARRIVGGFADEFDGGFVGRVNFSTEEYSQAFYDGGIVFFSTRVLTSPEVIARADFDSEILSVACSDRYVAVIVDQGTPQMPYRLEIFNADGGVAGEATFDMQYTGFDISGREIFIYNNSELRIFSPNGHEKAYIVADDFEISKVIRRGLPAAYTIVDGNDYIGIDLN